MRTWLSLSSDLMLGLVLGGVLLAGVVKASAPPAMAQGAEPSITGAITPKR